MAVVRVPIDTYMFDKNFQRIMILREQGGGGGRKAAGAGGNKALAQRYQNMQAPGMAGAGSEAMKRQMGQFRNRVGDRIQGSEERTEFDPRFVPLTEVDPASSHLARQLRPAHMAIIAGSFPYKAQLDEFKFKLHLASIQDVFNDTIEDGKDKLPAFRFLGMLIQREELDDNGKVVSQWADLDLAGSYKLWLLNSGLPFEADDPRYDSIKFAGLVMPRLREFHEEAPHNQMEMGPSGSAGARPEAAREAAPRKESESKYPDIEGQLKEIDTTLDKLKGAKPQQIAAPPSKFRTQNFDPFNPGAPAAAPDGAAAADRTGDEKADGPQDAVPEHCLVRLVDVTIEPGKFYRYRLKVKMANPNYNNPNVASPSYKREKELVSPDWYEIPQTVSIPTEQFYYVVDQKHVKTDGPKNAGKPPKGDPMFDIWMREPDRDRQVAFQFQRWVEATPIVPDGEPVPVGDWAVADRIFVARGEYVGQTVKVDLPVWKYTQDSYVLPAEDQRRRVRGGSPPASV